MKYKSPINDQGQEYFVPIVTKSKEHLIGYLSAFMYLLDVLEFPGIIDLNLDSSRFNDVVDDGRRLSTMTKAEIKKMMLSNITQYGSEEMDKKQKSHPDNKQGILRKSLLEFDCGCGGFYSFNKIDEIPTTDFSCGICGKLLIQYTGHYDVEYEFDGDEDRIAAIEKEFEEENPETDE